MKTYLFAATPGVPSGRGGDSRLSARKGRRARLCRLAALLICVLGAATAQAKLVPNLKFKDLRGRTVKLDSLRGRIAVVNFWATGCQPCKAELPRLSALRAEYHTQGVRFVAISVDDPKDVPRIRPFLQSQNIALRVWTGADLGTLHRLGFKQVIPATLVLDAQGNIVGRVEGELRTADVRSYVNWLLHKKQGAAPPAMIRRY